MSVSTVLASYHRRLRSLLWLSFVSLLFSFSAKAQTIADEFIMQRYPTFKVDEIKNAGIQSITIREMQKPSSRPIYDHSIRFTYFFNREGRLIGYRKTYPSLGGRIDTTEVKWIYINDELVQETERVGSYRRRITYKRMDSANVKQSISVKRGNSDWEPIDQEKRSMESIKDGHVEFIGGLNDQPYQRIVSLFNTSQQLTSREVWNGSRINSVESLSYINGNIASYRYKNILESKEIELEIPSSRETDIGRVCINEFCREWSIVNNDRGWPKGWIFMNPKTEDMEIWEFDYKYWR